MARKFSFIALLVTFFGVSGSASSVIETGCGVFIEREGQIEFVETPNLKVAEYSESVVFSGFHSDDGGKISMIMCSRDSLIPMPFDYQILNAGIVLAIKDGERLVVLERSGGNYRVRPLDGAVLRDDEISAIAERLKGFPNLQ